MQLVTIRPIPDIDKYTIMGFKKKVQLNNFNLLWIIKALITKLSALLIECKDWTPIKFRSRVRVL